VAANALELARNGVPKAPFYVTGRIGDRAFSVHAEGERMILKREGQERKEVDLASPQAVEVPLVPDQAEPQIRELPLPVCPDGSPRGGLPPEPGVDQPGASALDAAMEQLDEAMGRGPAEADTEQGGVP
jgi:hypothetical protein